jgi:excisionase family DNA binding protein
MNYDTTTGARTISVPLAGARYLGLSRGAAYRAAAEGVIPTIRVGRLLKVPISAMEKLLESAADRGGK